MASLSACEKPPARDGWQNQSHAFSIQVAARKMILQETGEMKTKGFSFQGIYIKKRSISTYNW